MLIVWDFFFLDWNDTDEDLKYMVLPAINYLSQVLTEFLLNETSFVI